MKITFLDASTLGEDIDLSPVGELGELCIFPGTSEEEVLKNANDSDVLILNKVKINEKTLPDPGKVKLICITATGFDNVDLDFCRKNNIAVCNVVGYSTDSVAQITIATVLYLASHLNEFNAYVRSGEYTDSGIANRLVPVYRELSGQTWGIVGCGNIGTKVGQVAEALGCRVIVNKRTPHAFFETVDLDTLCSESDIITIHSPLNDATRGIIGAEKIALMKDGVILVNEARGAVTDEAAVTEAVKNGKIGAFGTDVYSVEPFGREHPFTEIMHMDNVCLTPHMAWGAYESRKRCLDEVIMNIKSFVEGNTRNRIDL